MDARTGWLTGLRQGSGICGVYEYATEERARFFGENARDSISTLCFGILPLTEPQSRNLPDRLQFDRNRGMRAV